MENTDQTTPPAAEAPAAPSASAEDHGTLPASGENLGYLELFRADPEPESEPSPTDNVLARTRTSAWDF